ncbi:MAG: hypothetical protein Q4G35_05040, partial [Propionibacteriaceae bacterium]|nr:hypothetical protein [Propionibacteriaceae bacterium]
MLLRGLGVTLDVSLAESSLDEAEFRRLWSRCLQTDGEPAAQVELASHGSYVSATQAITRALIEERWGELLMLHAGAVADPASGRALAYVAPGGTGKSTLTRLLSQEWGYLSDETVGIDPASLAIRPYPKPLTWAAEAGKPKEEHAPDEMGFQPTPSSPTLAALAVLRRTDGAEATFRPLGLHEALKMIVPETSSLSKLPRPLHLFAEVYERVGGVTLVEYGEAEDLLEWCRESLGAGLATPGPAHGRSVNESSAWVDVQDFLVIDDEAIVLSNEKLLELGPVATAIMQLMPRSVEELAVALEAQFGAPEDGELIPAIEAH